jgi:hypothetical protein
MIEPDESHDAFRALGYPWKAVSREGAERDGTGVAEA